MIFCFIIKITEKVDAGEGFQLADIGHIGTQHLVSLTVFGEIGVLVLYPEGHSLVSAIVLAEHSHKEKLRYDETVGEGARYLVIAVDSTSLADVKGIAERTTVPVSYLLFHSSPYTCVEYIALGLHVSEKESLTVGFLGILAVCRWTDVPVVVA